MMTRPLFLCAVGALFAACTSGWGPIAAVKDSGMEDMEISRGILTVSPRCTFLESGGRRTLLVWPDARTSWNPWIGVITFKRDDRDIDARNGERIAVGGSGWSRTEGGQTVEELAARIEWVSPPAPECLVESVWFVGSVLDPPTE